MNRLTLKIYGKVQGIFFRQTVKETAQKLGLTGFAKNENNGSVTIVAEGEKNKLDEFINLVKRGFDYAGVETAAIEWGSAAGKFDNFLIL